MPFKLSSFMRPTIVFMSDFGWASPGVGLMKGMALAICPAASIIDLTHDIEPFSTINGACMLETAATLPPGGIYVCVVDPGVGSTRRVLAMRTKRGDFLIGPDNGVLLPAAQRMGGVADVVSVTDARHLPPRVGTTFDGRDVMAPAAAALANGAALAELGAPVAVAALHPPAYEEASWGGQGFTALVAHITRYGNVYLNIDNAAFREKGFRPGMRARVRMIDGAEREIKICGAFADVPKGEALLFEGHQGRVQAALNLGSFAESMKVKLGATLMIGLSK